MYTCCNPTAIPQNPQTNNPCLSSHISMRLERKLHSKTLKVTIMSLSVKQHEQDKNEFIHKLMSVN